MSYKVETWLVSADHVHMDYRFEHTPVKVTQMSDGYFATHPKLGCGKTFATPEAAIQHLFADHACTDIRAHTLAQHDATNAAINRRKRNQ